MVYEYLGSARNELGKVKGKNHLLERLSRRHGLQLAVRASCAQVCSKRPPLEMLLHQRQPGSSQDDSGPGGPAFSQHVYQECTRHDQEPGPGQAGRLQALDAEQSACQS